MTPMRLSSETVTLAICGGGNAIHEIDVSIARDANGQGDIREIVFVGRGKIGHALDLMFADLGVQLSRAIQGRLPLVESEND